LFAGGHRREQGSSCRAARAHRQDCGASMIDFQRAS
jgi:hypothetical protein